LGREVELIVSEPGYDDEGEEEEEGKILYRKG